MKLLPTLRQKKRYVVFAIVSDKKFSFPDLKMAVESSWQQFWGDFGKAKAAPLLLKEKFNQDQQRFLIKVNHKHVDELKAALTLNKKIKNTPVILKSIITSGTLKKASSYLTINEVK